jgi:hypothetical protein
MPSTPSNYRCWRFGGGLVISAQTAIGFNMIYDLAKNSFVAQMAAPGPKRQKCRDQQQPYRFARVDMRQVVTSL